MLSRFPHVRGLLGSVWRAVFSRFENQYEKALSLEIDQSIASLLDVGCGFNSPVQYLKQRPRRLVGVDAFEPAIEKSRLLNIHDEYYALDLLDIGAYFPAQSFDCVLASDVIEHLEVKDALNLISQMETIARKKVIIYTPNGFLEQGEEYGNPLQRHLSGWTAKQMMRMGYEIVGIQGWKPLRGEMARIRWWPSRFWESVSLLSQLVVTTRPNFAFRILCIRLMNP